MRLVVDYPIVTCFLKKTRSRKCLTLICAFSVLSLSLYTVHVGIVTVRYYNPPTASFSNNNYFLSAEELVSIGYLVHTPTCSILNVSAYDDAILPILIEEDIPPGNCRSSESREWTYTLNSSLVINVTAMTASGYSLQTVFCCYFSITRVTQSIDNYDANADRKVRYSSECTPLTRPVTPLVTPFVRVHCRAKYWPFSSDILYRRFHAVALLPKTTSFQRKSKHWKTSGSIKPPNVLIIGIDSMSRLGFHRTMPKTMQVLRDLGAVEMLGYTKVGENTLPNIIAALAGYTESDLRSSCWEDSWKAQDTCVPHYIWERFSAANYTTALLEDATAIATFNYMKTGFVKVPTDFYVRPFMIAVEQQVGSAKYTYYCVGSETVDEIMLRYITDTVKTMQKAQLPLFLFSWMTNLAHGDLMRPKYADDLYANYLSTLDLSNTLLFFIGDHGYRFGKIRQTFPGWYEDKLPNFWAYLPPAIRKSHPHWLKSLQVNSQRLTSTLDLFWTLNQILDEFSSTPSLPLLRHRVMRTELQRSYGQSLFSQVPLKRKCQEAGIRDTFCACVVPKRLSTNDTHLQEAAAATIAYINVLLPPQCTQLDLSTVDAGAMLNDDTDDDYVSSTYVVAFHTVPGQFQFESTTSYRKNKTETEGVYKVTSDVLRMNSITTDVSCVQENFLERLCFCATQKSVQS